MTGQFPKKIVLVTGGQSGIGKAVVVEFIKQGATVISADVIPGPFSADELTPEQAKSVDCQSVDASKVSDIKRLEAYIKAKYGLLNVCVNNAGIGGKISPNMHEYPIEEWDRVMDLNLRGAFLVLQASIRLMLPQKSGAVINISSLSAISYIPNSPAYPISKAAVISMTRQAGVEYGSRGIRVNAVAPGFISTPLLNQLNEKVRKNLTQNPQRRLGQPEEIANLVVFLASDQASYINGQVFFADGGRSAM